jgi:hypothetical protein
VGLQRVQAHGIAYTVTVHAVSDLKMVVTATQNGYAPGSEVELRATLTDSGIPLERQAAVTVDVTLPDGTAHNAALIEEEPGVHRVVLALPQVGLYPLLVRASGQSFSGAAFTREELRSAAVWADPVIRPPGPGQWCDLLLCILEDDRAGHALAERGVNVEGVRDCLRRFCERAS